MSSTCVNLYARMHVIYVYTERRRGPWNLPKSSAEAHSEYLALNTSPGIKANYNALWISIIGDSTFEGKIYDFGKECFKIV